MLPLFQKLVDFSTEMGWATDQSGGCFETSGSTAKRMAAIHGSSCCKATALSLQKNVGHRWGSGRPTSRTADESADFALCYATCNFWLPHVAHAIVEILHRRTDVLAMRLPLGQL